MNLGLSDVGFFRKKNNDINPDGDFSNSLGICKRYGAAILDCFGIVAGVMFTLPLVFSAFNRDSKDGDTDNNRKSRRRH